MHIYSMYLKPILIGLLVSIVLSGSAVAETATKPNILVIVTDDQGYADLSAFKHHAQDVHTPNMDRLAARGILFTEAYTTAPVCSPSRAGWNTGQHQVRWDPASSFNCGLPDDIPTMAEILKVNGYATARIGKSDYSNDSIHRKDTSEYPLNHGYDEFLGFCAHGFDYFLLTEEIEARTPDPRGHSASVGPLMHNRGRKEFKEGYLTEIFTDAAIDFFDRNQDNPFYLTLAYNSVHHLVHQVPKRYLDKLGVREIPNYNPEVDGNYADWFQRFIFIDEISDEEMRKYYLANLECLDDNIGRVLDALEELALADDTLVIFFSDNGAAPTNGGWNLPLAGSKFTLWEGGIRVPFILSRPGDPHAGETWAGPVSTLDVLPTCLQAAGIDLPHNMDGQPIPKTVEEIESDRALFWRWQDRGGHLAREGDARYAVRFGDWKLLYRGGRSNRKPTSGVVNRTELLDGIRLFNLREDPSESRDLAAEYPEVVERIQDLYTEWSERVVGSYIGAN